MRLDIGVFILGRISVVCIVCRGVLALRGFARVGSWGRDELTEYRGLIVLYAALCQFGQCSIIWIGIAVTLANPRFCVPFVGYPVLIIVFDEVQGRIVFLVSDDDR